VAVTNWQILTITESDSEACEKEKEPNIKQTIYPLMRSRDTGLIMCCIQ